MQEYLVSELGLLLTEYLDTPVQLEGLDIELLEGVVLEELYVEDYAGDTLLHVRELVAGLRYFDVTNNELNLSKIKLDGVTFQLTTDSVGNLNLNRILDKFSSEKVDTTASSDFRMRCSSFVLHNSNFLYSSYQPDVLKKQLNFEDIELRNMNIVLHDFELLNDSMQFELDELSFRDKSGFKVRQLSGKVNASGRGVFADSLILATPYTNAHFKRLYLKTIDWGSYVNFFTDVFLIADLKRGSTLHLRDLNYLGAGIPMEKRLRLAGSINGALSSFNLLDFSVGIGRSSKLKLSGNSFGLPDIASTFWNISIDSFDGNIGDINEFLSSVTGGLPQQTKRMGDFEFEGKIVGMTFDIVADLQLNAWYGGVQTDVKVSQLDTTKYEITGLAEVKHLNLGYLLADSVLGCISLKDTLQFVIDTRGSYSLTNAGRIDSVEYNKYTYKNIDLNGNLNNKAFDGRLRVNDPNLDFDLHGKINLNEEIPDFEFAASSKVIDFVAINLDKVSSTSRLNFDMYSKFRGSHLDNLSGKIFFDTINYQTGRGSAPFDSLSLYVGKQDSVKKMTIHSNYFGATMEGDFNFATIGKAAMAAVYHFFPVLQLGDVTELKDALTSDNALIDKNSNPLDTLQNFTFNVELGNFNRVIHLFAPEVYIATNTRCNGFFRSAEQKLKFSLVSDSIGVGARYIDEPKFSIDMYNTSIVSNITAKSISITDKLALRNLKTYVQSQANDNRLSMLVDWNNRLDTLNFAGNLNLDFEAYQSFETGNLNYLLRMNESNITLDQDSWLLQEAQVVVDTTTIFFNDVVFSAGAQQMSINGIISDQPEDELKVELRQVKMAAANPLLKDYAMRIGGRLSGKVSLTNLLRKPRIVTKDSVESFAFNGQELGNLYLSSEWNNEQRELGVELSLFSKLFQKNTFLLKGVVLPEESKMDFNLALRKFNLHPIESFMVDIASDIRGSVSGDMRINGKFDDPQIDGKFGLHRVSAEVDYIQTRYAVQENEILIDNNKVQFDNALIRDPRGKFASLDLLVNHSMFDSISLDMLFEARNFQVLHTTELDNDMFYGNAFVTGDVKLTGPLDNMAVIVQAKPEANTELFVPLNSAGSVSDFNFIQFNKGFGEEFNGNTVKEYEVDLSGMRLNINLDVTEDAKLQLIMDKKVGDVISVIGEGNLALDIDTKGDFIMFGEYKIIEGDYLFTLKNLINKKFEVEKGSAIKWNGDPVNAELDLKTLYRLKKIPVKDLYGLETTSEEEESTDPRASQKVNVDCKLVMTGSLEKPKIGFNLDIDDDGGDVNQDINKLTEEERNKQFLSLLVMNKFQPLFGGIAAGSGNSDIIGSNATELLSNQLSVLLSQISDDFDMDVKYKMGDGETQSELEVGVSTELLNNRLNIQVSGNMNMGQSASQNLEENDGQNNGLEGDYEMSYKLSKSGKARAKYFGRANKVISTRRIPFMQGVGFMYREEFDTFQELFHRYKLALWGKKNTTKTDSIPKK